MAIYTNGRGDTDVAITPQGTMDWIYPSLNNGLGGQYSFDSAQGYHIVRILPELF